jgi:pantoate--beta-alanine ligase
MSPSSPAIRTVRTVGELRDVLGGIRRADPEAVIGLVPTMGALHEGHLSLIERAREECEVVVVSLFVNPAQFNEQSDLDGYPRKERNDAQLSAQAGAGLLFAPSNEEVYPDGFATAVEVSGLTEGLEGAARGAAHFRGVTTVVCKLMNMVQPDVAFFGQKDAQQVVVLERLVSDLNIPVEIRVCPTVREPDGLACSSRNALLDPHERIQARALYAGLSAALGLACDGESCGQALTRAVRAAMVALGVEPEYLALVDPHTFEPIVALDRVGLLAVAARVGSTRLIDNVVLYPYARSQRLQAVGGRARRTAPDRGHHTAFIKARHRRREAKIACSA